MLTYWILYLIPAGMALFIERTRQSKLLIWYFIGFFFIFIIGFRDKIGCDWDRYVTKFEYTIGMTFEDAMMLAKDPANQFFNWLVGSWGGDIHDVNFIYAIIFVIGLIKFSRTQTYPLIALAVAVPYMVIMVAMGYSRQGVALGLFMFAITYLEKGKFKSYIVWVLIAALFHKSAIILLPFGLFLAKGGLWLRIIIMIPVLYGGWDLFLEEKHEQLWNTYVEQQMQSAGAKIRVFMNFIPAVLLLMYRKQWKENYSDYSFWFWVSIGSIASMFLVGAATTAVDRVSLYFIPIQMAVYSRIPLFARKYIPEQMTTVVILLGYVSVLFVWLVYASHSHCWLPYKNVLFNLL